MKVGGITKTTKKNKKVISLAKKVKNHSDRYKIQLNKCEKKTK